MFMDDLKVYEEAKADLDETIAEVEELSMAVGMILGLRKCAVAHVEKGKVIHGGNMLLPTGGTIKEVQYGETYKCLGVAQLFGTNLAKTKNRIRTEYLKRVRQTWGSELNAKNKINANNTWAAAVLRYFFAIIGWSKSDMRKLDRQTRNIMRKNQSHHTNSTINRLYLPRVEGGRGLTNVEQAWEREAISAIIYLLTVFSAEIFLSPYMSLSQYFNTQFMIQIVIPQ